MATSKNSIQYADFEKVDIRVGTIVEASEFKEARKPAYKLMIDLGPMGVKRSSAQITNLYSLHELKGKQVLCVVNFPPKQIGPYISEVLTLGLANENSHVVLVSPLSGVPNGAPLH